MPVTQRFNRPEGERAEEFPLSDGEFTFLAELVYQRTGIVLGDNKRNLLYSRLARRLRALGLASFQEYCSLLETPAADGELPHLVNAVTTNLTKFFREDHHFEHLRKTTLPALFAPSRRGARIRFWSAGCSSGQEPFSIAMTLREMVPDLARWDCKILATDLDSNMIARCESARYNLREVESIPAPLRQAYLQEVDEESYVFAGDIRRLITFRQLNLLDRWPMKGPFDVVFFRNVLIYFDVETQRAILERMHGLIADDGLLYAGHSENLARVTDRFALLGQTIYRKTPTGQP